MNRNRAIGQLVGQRERRLARVLSSTSLAAACVTVVVMPSRGPEMNTSEKGSRFELLVLRLLTEKLADGELGLLPEACSIYHRKGYYSRDRKKDIICDITIEMCLPGLIQWSLLWVWECKDLTGPVPVDDIEEFWAKLQQIGGVNIKGGMVSSKGFQDGTTEFARSKGIALAQCQRGPRTSLLIGASGSGKSSLLALGIMRHLMNPTESTSQNKEGDRDEKAPPPSPVSDTTSTQPKPLDRFNQESMLSNSYPLDSDLDPSALRASLAAHLDRWNIDDRNAFLNWVVSPAETKMA